MTYEQRRSKITFNAACNILNEVNRDLFLNKFKHPPVAAITICKRRKEGRNTEKAVMCVTYEYASLKLNEVS
jgi:hypothetical protein